MSAPPQFLQTVEDMPPAAYTGPEPRQSEELWWCKRRLGGRTHRSCLEWSQGYGTLLPQPTPLGPGNRNGAWG